MGLRNQFDQLDDKVEAKAASRPWVVIVVCLVIGFAIGAFFA